MNKRRIRYAPALLVAGSVVVLAVSSGGCSAISNAEAASQGCAGLDASTSTAQATVEAWVDTLSALQTAADDVQAEWLNVCNEMNADLGLDTSQTTASAACNVLNTKIQSDLMSGVTLTLTVSPPVCQADVGVQATCEANCTASANCDVQANCTPGDVVVGCNGSCSAQCDVNAPSFACSGTCSGECTASAAVQCMGACSGSCTAPTWTGTCTAGCSANFSGTCGGNCNGMCDGSSMTGGTCKGKCTGSCDASASGSCSAMCTGQFSGGTCSGMCTGSCTASGAVACNGTCNGTCSYTPGSASCIGECHGTCSAQTSPPTCTGALDCSANATCHSDCQAQAQAKLDCLPPQAQFDVEGDATLFSSFQTHLTDIAQAFGDTLALKDIIASVASQTESTFSAIGDVGGAGLTCIASEVQVAGNVQASISVSVSASATVSGSSS